MDMKKFWHDFLLIAIPTTAAAMLGFFVYLAVVHITIDPVAWSLFFNGTLPYTITKALFPLFTIYFLNWSHPGHPIAGILHVNKTSTVWEKFIAAFFLVGMAYTIAYSIRIG